MKSKKLMLFAGVISFLGGLLALNNPVETSFTLEQLLGWTCIVSGVFNFIGGMRLRGDQRIWTVLLAVFTLVLGYFFVRLPIESILSLTTLIIVLLMGSGIARVVMAFKYRGSNLFIPLVSSGLISFLLAVLLLTEFAGSAEAILGILFAVELISNGISLIILAFASSKIIGTLTHT